LSEVKVRIGCLFYSSAMKRPCIGIALGSGSARGWSHIGVLDALTAAGIEPDIVCGASIGALVGAAYVSGHLRDLRTWALAARRREIISLMDIRLTGGGLIEGKQILKLLDGLGIRGAIETYDKKYAAVATDLTTGREVWLKSGSVQDAVRASIALPGIISPVLIDGAWLVDGGLANPVPVSVCRALGADLTIAVNLNGDLLGRRFAAEAEEETRTLEPSIPSDFVKRILAQFPAAFRAQAAEIAPRLLPQKSFSPDYFGVLANSINIMQDHITRSRLAGEPPDILLAPQLRGIGLLEFNRAEDAIAEGQNCVEQALPALQRAVARLH
jgi:NTE family protein